MRAAPRYGAPSRGDRLIDAKAAAARPELAQQYRGVQAREQAQAEKAQAEKAQQARSAELAERFKNKVREDREQERGGRGGGDRKSVV